MVECIGPELDHKVGASEEGSDRIGQGPVSSLYRAILERSFIASGSDFISLGGEEISNIRVVIQFSTLVKVDILVLTSITGGIL